MARKKTNEDMPMPGIPRTTKVGEKHVWFLEDIPKFKINVPVVKSATLYLSLFDETKPSLGVLLNDIRQLHSGDRINLIFNSPGGLVSEGRALINAVLGTNADIQTELLSEASSMAAIMFCIGDRRIIYENSSLMFHNFSGGISGKGHEMKDYIKHAVKNLALFFKGHVIGLSDDEIDQMMHGKEFWFGAKALSERGIATHVSIDGTLVPVKRYLKALKKAKKLAKKQDIKISSIAEAMIFGIDVMSAIVQEQNESIDGVSTAVSELVATNELLYN